jgi:hypothetical protein
MRHSSWLMRVFIFLAISEVDDRSSKWAAENWQLNSDRYTVQLWAALSSAAVSSDSIISCDILIFGSTISSSIGLCRKCRALSSAVCSDYTSSCAVIISGSTMSSSLPGVRRHRHIFSSRGLNHFPQCSRTPRKKAEELLRVSGAAFLLVL